MDPHGAVGLEIIGRVVFVAVHTYMMIRIYLIKKNSGVMILQTGTKLLRLHSQIEITVSLSQSYHCLLDGKSWAHWCLDHPQHG